MPFPDEFYNLRIELDTKNFDFSQADLDQMEDGLNPLRDPVQRFPVSDLYITVTYHPTPNDYHVRTSLVLPSRTLLTGDRDVNPLTAWNRCVRKLVSKLAAYKENLELTEERRKAQEGTVQEVVPEAEPEVDKLHQAVEAGDYAAFREATYVYEEAVRKRAGRWIGRYPEFETELGISYKLDDLVEETFLNAFEYFQQRPQNLRLGRWLEALIDPSVKALLKNPEAEQQNIEAVRNLRDAASEEKADRED